jgi:hypothetical protein
MEAFLTDPCHFKWAAIGVLVACQLAASLVAKRMLGSWREVWIVGAYFSMTLAFCLVVSCAVTVLLKCQGWL